MITSSVDLSFDHAFSRPLPDEFVRYAREDTHYLLFIYDCLRNELLKNSVERLQLVYQRSKEICLKVSGDEMDPSRNTTERIVMILKSESFGNLIY